ncbi:hypothetical protein BBP40_008715 [Aspergillus hancockii]|nr:hypothetical protein BBP40_008715 [Aspergillus hancockii]
MDPTAQNPLCLLYGDARFEERPFPIIDDPHDVIVQIAYTGVCGSDAHFLVEWRDSYACFCDSNLWPWATRHPLPYTRFALQSPHSLLGIEQRLSLITHGVNAAKLGRYNLCPDMKFAADPPKTYGTLAKYFMLPANFCYKVPESISLAVAVLMEPLAVAVHAVRLADVKPGNRVVVSVSGPSGSFVLRW